MLLLLFQEEKIQLRIQDDLSNSFKSLSSTRLTKRGGLYLPTTHLGKNFKLHRCYFVVQQKLSQQRETIEPMKKPLSLVFAESQFNLTKGSTNCLVPITCEKGNLKFSIMLFL